MLSGMFYIVNWLSWAVALGCLCEPCDSQDYILPRVYTGSPACEDRTFVGVNETMA